MASQLISAQITAQQRLRALAARGVAAAWASLPAYDEQNLAQWLSLVLPIILATRRQSVALTDAYLARALRRQPAGIDAAVIIAGLRGSVPAREVYRRPFVTVWTALSKSTPYEQAVDAGRARAVSSTITDVQLAHRATLQAVQDSDPQIRGYRRVADPDACAFCRTIDGAFIKSAAAAPLHPGCGCGLEPVQDEVPSTPVPADVAVSEHGELGAYLGDPAHDFTSAADLG